MQAMLLTGSGGAASIGYARSIRDSGRNVRVVGCDANPLNIPFSEAKPNYAVPKASDGAYLDSLNRIIRKESIEFIHAQPDYEVAAISAGRSKLDAATFIPRHEVITTCQDKFKSYTAWKDSGITVPNTILIRCESDLEEALEQVKPPFWIRAIKGAGGKGSFIVKEKKQAADWISYWDGWGNFVASELLPGRLFTWQSIWFEGELVVAQGRERLSWGLSSGSVTGVTGMTGIARTVAISELDEVSEKAIRAVDSHPHGIYGVDLKCNSGGVPCPTEINIGRFFTTIHFFSKAGLNLPSIELDLVEGKTPQITQKYNPIKGEYFWLRSVDTEPRFVQRSELKGLISNEADIGSMLEPDKSINYRT